MRAVSSWLLPDASDGYSRNEMGDPNFTVMGAKPFSPALASNRGGAAQSAYVPSQPQFRHQPSTAPDYDSDEDETIGSGARRFNPAKRSSSSTPSATTSSSPRPQLPKPAAEWLLEFLSKATLDPPAPPGKVVGRLTRTNSPSQLQDLAANPLLIARNSRAFRRTVQKSPLRTRRTPSARCMAEHNV